MKRKTNKAKRTDSHCRNNGQCPECRGSRTHATRKRIAAARDELKEYLG